MVAQNGLKDLGFYFLLDFLTCRGCLVIIHHHTLDHSSCDQVSHSSSFHRQGRSDHGTGCHSSGHPGASSHLMQPETCPKPDILAKGGLVLGKAE